MGSGHILVYMFDVLEQIYTSVGYSEREAAKAILENNIYGLDIDDRAYQLAYFAVMMKARQYNRRILTSGIKAHVYSIQESNGITKNQLQEMGKNLSPEGVWQHSEHSGDGLGSAPEIRNAKRNFGTDQSELESGGIKEADTAHRSG